MSERGKIEKNIVWGVKLDKTVWGVTRKNNARGGKENTRFCPGGWKSPNFVMENFLALSPSSFFNGIALSILLICGSEIYYVN